MTDKSSFRIAKDLAAPILILLAVWAVVALIVNPCGEFFVNDDWSFVKIVETLGSGGAMPATGWGKGGPSAIVHVLWGKLFRYFGGPSLTVLRLSVVTMGVLSSLVLLILLRVLGASKYLSLWGALTLVFNPLFLSQSFTFMTDVTFCGILLSSVLFLYVAVDRRSTGFMVLGLFFCLLAILTRQIGIVVPLGFIMVSLFHPRGRELGRVRVVLLTVGVALAPWMGYEYFLSAAGSTPVTSHAVFHNILDLPRSYGPWGYAELLARHFFLAALGYTCLFASPILALRYPYSLSETPLKQLFILITAGFVVVEGAILAGWIRPAVTLHYNVIFDLGIGPILLKDTYILQTRRVVGLSSEVYYLLLYLVAVAQVVVWSLAIQWLRKLFGRREPWQSDSLSFLGSLALCTAVLYLGIIQVTAFHDRYLIPVCALVVIWLMTAFVRRDLPVRWSGMAPAAVMLLGMAAFSVAGVHDFMELKRAQDRADTYVVKELKTSRCDFDGGFEYNGYHCYRKDRTSAEGASWWWVDRENYVLTLGPVPGYRVVKTFPFDRYLGSNGAIHILEPVGKAGESH